MQTDLIGCLRGSPLDGDCWCLYWAWEEGGLLKKDRYPSHYIIEGESDGVGSESFWPRLETTSTGGKKRVDNNKQGEDKADDSKEASEGGNQLCSFKTCQSKAEVEESVTVMDNTHTMMCFSKWTMTQQQMAERQWTFSETLVLGNALLLRMM